MKEWVRLLPQLRFKINRICKNKKDYNNNIIHDKDTQHLVRSQKRKKRVHTVC